MIKAGAKKDGLDISEQYLVDCGFGKNGANGCNGAQPGSYAKFYNENGKENNWKNVCLRNFFKKVLNFLLHRKQTGDS